MGKLIKQYTKESNAPLTTPDKIAGKVTSRHTAQGLAPNVRALSSYAGASRTQAPWVIRAERGPLKKAWARTVAHNEGNTCTLRPNKNCNAPLNHPCVPNMSKKPRATVTAGMTKGTIIKDVTSRLPRKERLANTYARGMPTATLSNVDNKACQAVKRMRRRMYGSVMSSTNLATE